MTIREIKFRAWVFGEMYRVKQLDDSGVRCDHPTLPEVGFSWRSIDHKDFSLMQFTGLKSFDGEDIYEGDVVVPVTLMNYDKQRKIVEWKDAGWNLRPGHPQHKGYKLLGNIFEHPNLIEGGAYA